MYLHTYEDGIFQSKHPQYIHSKSLGCHIAQNFGRGLNLAHLWLMMLASNYIPLILIKIYIFAGAKCFV